MAKVEKFEDLVENPDVEDPDVLYRGFLSGRFGRRHASYANLYLPLHPPVLSAKITDTEI